jgi:hypothetical protein
MVSLVIFWLAILSVIFVGAATRLMVSRMNRSAKAREDAFREHRLLEMRPNLCVELPRSSALDCVPKFNRIPPAILTVIIKAVAMLQDERVTFQGAIGVKYGRSANSDSSHMKQRFHLPDGRYDHSRESSKHIRNRAKFRRGVRIDSPFLQVRLFEVCEQTHLRKLCCELLKSQQLPSLINTRGLSRLLSVRPNLVPRHSERSRDGKHHAYGLGPRRPLRCVQIPYVLYDDYCANCDHCAHVDPQPPLHDFPHSFFADRSTLKSAASNVA